MILLDTRTSNTYEKIAPMWFSIFLICFIDSTLELKKMYIKYL